MGLPYCLLRMKEDPRNLYIYSINLTGIDYKMQIS